MSLYLSFFALLSTIKAEDPAKSLAESIRVEQFEIIEPRNFAYHIGDSLIRTIHLQLRKPYLLKTELLPVKKRMGRWMLITSSSYQMKESAESTEYEIKIHYQIVNMIPKLKEVILPRHYLTYSKLKSKSVARLDIPPRKVGVSSVINAEQVDIQADRKPVLITHTYKNMIVSGLVLLSALLGLAYLLWGLPASRKKQPFGEAYHSLKNLRRKQWGEKQYSKALKIIHQAFNEAADKTIFADKTDFFFSEHPYYLPLKVEINNFYQHSEQHFFKQTIKITGTSSDTKNELSQLIYLIRACRRIEKARL